MDMEKVYQVKHYLHSSKIDRQYPYKFHRPLDVQGKTFVKETIDQDYDGIDTIQVYCNFHEVEVNPPKFIFSPTSKGNVSLLTVEPVNESIPVNEDFILEYNVHKNYTAQDQSDGLTGVESIKLDFDDDATGVTIYDIVFRTKDYSYTLKDIERAYEDGTAYVIRRLNELNLEKKCYKQVPSSLMRYVYMASGAYAWLIQWENEAKAMKEPKSESNNYADRLFGQIDSGLQKYLETIDNDPSKDYINMGLIASAECEWGIR